jgi:hypothetical protein
MAWMAVGGDRVGRDPRHGDEHHQVKTGDYRDELEADKASEESVADIPHLEHLYKLLTNWNIGLLSAKHQ